MRKFLLVLLCLFIAGCNRPDAYDSKGNPIRLEDFKGKWVLINYWATWCKPCLKEMPELNSTYLLNSNKAVVLGVSFDHLTDDVINQFGKTKNLRFPLLRRLLLSKMGLGKQTQKQAIFS